MPLMAAVVLAVLAQPGVYFEQTTRVLSKDPAAAGPGVSTRVWHAGKRMRLESGGVTGQAFVLRLDQGWAFRLDSQRKTAVEVNLRKLVAQSQEDLSAAAQLMGTGPSASVRTARLKGVRTIAGHACSGYRLTAASAVLDVWVAEDLPVGMDTFTEFLEWSGATAAMAPLMAELKAIRGFPLETRSRINILGDIQESLTTISRVRVEPIPASMFDVPKGYAIERAGEERDR